MKSASLVTNGRAQALAQFADQGRNRRIIHRLGDSSQLSGQRAAQSFLGAERLFFITRQTVINPLGLADDRDGGPAYLAANIVK